MSAQDGPLAIGRDGVPVSIDFGYVRASKSRDHQLQRDALTGIPTERIYSDTKDGDATDRPGLTTLLGNVRPGDTIVVHALNVLGSNLSDVVSLVLDLARRGVRVRSIAIPRRADEQLAFEVANQVLGTSVHLWDTNSYENAVDAVMVHPDGRVAALEFSSIGPEEEARINNWLGNRGHCRDIAGLTHAWYVDIPSDFHPDDLPLIDPALLRCEELGVDHLHGTTGQDPAIDSLMRKGANAEVLPTTVGGTATLEARAYVHVDSAGGLLGEGIEPLVDELAAELLTLTMQSKIAKLAASGVEVRCLLLLVRPSAFSYPVYDGLFFGGSLPSKPPRLPDSLSQVWLLSEWTDRSVVRAVADGGWCRDYSSRKTWLTPQIRRPPATA